MREVILLFHFTDKDRRNRLTRALFPLRMRIKEISLEDYGKPVGCLAGIKELEPKGEICTGDELTGELLVMAGLDSNRIDQVLRAVRKSGVSVPYKAVLTAENQNWNVWQLFEEIKAEHERMNR
ncbi:MAG: DUF3783 domain-containing protein [Lachnospiraceae bacterium]|nr:DUF3783 domain-containing protein [Lachnospiraceae bacterium]